MLGEKQRISVEKLNFYDCIFYIEMGLYDNQGCIQWKDAYTYLCHVWRREKRGMSKTKKERGNMKGERYGFRTNL
jgi:hypothetical protein